MSFISPIATDSNGNARATGSQQVLGKDDFLQLLVTKLQYQDPLKPMEDEDFIAQLAQFSSLEQMNNISEGIQTSNQWDFLQMQSMNNVLAAGFIGKDVKAEFSGVYVDAESEPRISFTTSQFAQQINFVISDETGKHVRTVTAEDVAAGSGTVKWDGKDTLGNRVPEGSYTIAAEAVSGSGEKFIPKLALVGQVSTVIYREGQAYLIVDGTEISLGDVAAIGEPGSFTDDV